MIGYITKLDVIKTDKLDMKVAHYLMQNGSAGTFFITQEQLDMLRPVVVKKEEILQSFAGLVRVNMDFNPRGRLEELEVVDK